MTIGSVLEAYGLRAPMLDWDPPCPECGEQPDACNDSDCQDWCDLLARPVPDDPYGPT